MSIISDELRDFFVSFKEFESALLNVSLTETLDMRTFELVVADLYSKSLKLKESGVIEGRGDSMNRRSLPDFQLAKLKKIASGLQLGWVLSDSLDRTSVDPLNFYDDVCDIYSDLSILSAVTDADQIESANEVESQIAFLFRVHWGRHCRNILNYAAAMREAGQS